MKIAREIFDSFEELYNPLLGEPGGYRPKIVKEFEPEKVIIFGSRVRGTAKKISDIDFIVVFSFFANIPFLKRMPPLLRKASFPKHVSYICYTPEEYERIRNASSFIMDALENSMEVVV